MIYLKSLLAGLLAVVASSAALLILAIIAMILYVRIHPMPDGTSIGWDPISLMRQRPIWLISLLVVPCVRASFGSTAGLRIDRAVSQLPRLRNADDLPIRPTAAVHPTLLPQSH